MLKKRFFGLAIVGLMMFLFSLDYTSAQSVTYVKSFSTNQVATMTTADLGQTVYALDGASPLLCADIFGNDGNEEIFFMNGDRFLGLDSNNQQITYQDGRGLVSSREGAALILRVDDGSSQEEKYVVVKSGQSSCSLTNCPTWYAHQQLDLHALNSFNGYVAGQKISSVPFTSFSGDAIYWLSIGKLRPVITSDEEIAFIAADRDFGRMQVAKLKLNLNGSLTFVPGGEMGCPTYSAPGAGCHRGNAQFHTKICRQNGAQCTGVYDEYIFNNHFFSIENGIISEKGSWFDYNGQVVPVVQGGTWTINFIEGATNSHVDSMHIINLGTDQMPDYRMILMFDADGARVLSARISIDVSGQLTVAPLWATIGGSFPGFAAQNLAVGYVKGLAGGPHVVNGRYVFDADTGELLADMNLYVTASTNNFAFSDSRIWPTNSKYGYAIDKNIGFGAEPPSSGTIFLLRHLLPFLQSINAPTSTIAPFQTTFREIGSNLPSGLTPTGNTDQGGIIRNIGLCADYDVLTNSVSFDLVKVRNQQHASLLRSTDRTSLVNNIDQDKKDIVNGLLQQTQVTAHRGYDGWSFWNELDNSNTNVCLGTGALCSNQVGVCSGSIEQCIGGSYVCNFVAYSISAQSQGSSFENVETLCDDLDNDCDGLVDETCAPNAPSQLSAAFSG